MHNAAGKKPYRPVRTCTNSYVLVAMYELVATSTVLRSSTAGSGHGRRCVFGKIRRSEAFAGRYHVRA